MDILRSIGMGLCSMIYPLIKTFYTLFYQIARAKFLTDDTINSLSNNIYILVSVVMLFSLGVQLLRSIVNPDLLLDNKKGTTAIVKRVVVSLFLIVLIPIVFSYSFIIQDKIISSNVIEKLIVGYNSDKSLGDSNAGQIFAGIALNTVFYPQAESSSVEGLAEDYNKMINEDIGLISDVGDYVNEKTDEDSNSDNYVFYFNGLVALVAGIFILYMLVLYCMDVGLRLVKLSFLQLTVPISIMAYLASGKDSLEKWVKEVISTYFGLFVKIGALAFMLFAMGHIDEITGSFGDNDKWVKLFVLIGLLQFVHSAPDLILKLFGVKIGGRGGIRGRLGEMAGVGNIAQNAWNRMRNPLAAAATVAAGVGAVGSHLTAAGQNSINRGREVSDRISQRTGNRRLGRALGVAAGLIGIGGGAVGALGAGYRGVRSGNLNEIGNARNRYQQTHPSGSTFLGRTADAATSALGFGTAQERHDRRATSYDMFVDQNGNYYANGGAGRNAIRLNQDQLDAQRNIYNNIQARRTAIRDAAAHSLERENSDLRTTINGITGNYHQLADSLNNLRNSGPQRSAYATDAAYQAALASHQTTINNFENALRSWHDSMRDKIVDNTISGSGAVDANGARIDIRGTADGNTIINSSNVLNQTLTDNPITDLTGHTITNANDTITLNTLNNLANEQIGLFDTIQQTQEQRNIQEQRSDAGRRRQANDQAYHARQNNRNGNNS